MITKLENNIFYNQFSCKFYSNYCRVRSITVLYVIAYKWMDCKAAIDVDYRACNRVTDEWLLWEHTALTTIEVLIPWN